MEVWAAPASPPQDPPAFVGARPSWSDGSAYPVSVCDPANDPCADFFAGLGVAVVFPHLHSLLTAPVSVGNQTVQVALGNSPLDVTASPQIQLGAFRFGPGYGELEFTYRFLATSGHEVIADFDQSGDAVLRSRLNLQLFHIDYAKNEYCLEPGALLRWEAGILLQVCFFDNQAQSAVLFEQARNSFYGAGPRGGLSIFKSIGSDLSLFGHCDGALAVGYNTVQNFVVGFHDANNHPISGSADQEQSHISPSFAVQVGIGWKPASLPASSFRGGYQFMQWYNLGRVNDSRGDLSAHGLFLNWEYSF